LVAVMAVLAPSAARASANHPESLAPQDSPTVEAGSAKKEAKTTKTQAAVKQKEKARAKETKVAVTGSLIKRQVNRSGRIADTGMPLQVIDRNEIEQSGASDLAGVFRRRAIH